MLRAWRHFGWVALWLVSLGPAPVGPMSTMPAVRAEGSTADLNGLRFYETRIRPLLIEQCGRCHGEQKREGDLRLDTPLGLSRGGQSGGLMVAGSPDSSLLIAAVRYQDESLRMPPDGKLSDVQIADLVRWIEMGAPHPESNGARRDVRSRDREDARQFWSFQLPRRAKLPPPSQPGWAASPLDHFVQAKLVEQRLAVSARADSRTLLRRVTFDLIGLPPDGDEVGRFVADDSPDSLARVVDRLLASPHYGERWGRHWLDIVRYADSNGLDENIAHGNAWRYRDYVIASLNKDKPYDTFLHEQVAGDLLPSADEPQRHERLIATGFLALGPKVLAEVDEQKMEMDIIDEQLDTLGRAVLGLTIGCARCHDHKFDPFTSEDYYALAGILKSTRTMEHFTKIAKWWENEIPSAEDRERLASFQREFAERKTGIEQLVQHATQALQAAEGAGHNPKDAEARFPEATRAELKRLRDKLAALEKTAPVVPTAMGVREGQVADLHVHLRGSHLTLGKLVPRRFPELLAGESQPTPSASQSGRLELAHWLTAPQQPLTARVIVNRVWRWHFGQGLVGSTDNFGVLGELPRNQPLLDWLAVDFVETGWSIKRLHRKIVESATWQMASEHREEAAAIDPDNRWQWRAGVRRLEAETLRDALLAVGDTLDRSMGGSLLHVKNREFLFDHTSKDRTRYDSGKRSVYLPVIRNHLYDVFQLFDYSDAAVPNGDRATSTVAPQALFMMNSDLVADVTASMARASQAAGVEFRNPNSGAPSAGADDDRRRIAWLHERALGRGPTPAETERLLAFLNDVEGTFAATELDVTSRRERAWQALCHALIASNEFVTVR